MLPARNQRSAENRAGPGERNATICSIAYRMGFTIAPQGNAARIDPQTGDMHAKKTTACEMLFVFTIATEQRIASVCSFSINHYACTLSTAFCMFGTIDHGRTLVRPGTGDCDARTALAFQVIIRTTSKNGIAGIGAGSREDYACGKIFGAFGVFATSDCDRAIVRSGTVNGDTLIFVVARHMAFAAAEEWIAVVGSFAGNGDAGGVIGSALCVFSTFNGGGAFIGTGSIHGYALIGSIACRVPKATAEKGIACIRTWTGGLDAGGKIWSTREMRHFTSTTNARKSWFTIVQTIDSRTSDKINNHTILSTRSSCRQYITGAIGQ